MFSLWGLIYYLVVFVALFLGALMVLISLDPRNGVPGPGVIYRTIGRDLRALIMYVEGRIFVGSCVYRDQSTAQLFQEMVKKNPYKVCLVLEDHQWTYLQLEEFSNKVANYFDQSGFKKGDEVALFMENRPEFVGIWLGLSKIGVITALINTNLRLNALANSINVIDCKLLIYGEELKSAVEEVMPLLENRNTMKYFQLEEDVTSPPGKSLKEALKDISATSPDPKKHKIGFEDKVLYIYTSGTTGLPKAAVIRHSRLIWCGVLTKIFMRIKDSDVIYNPLPLYHSAGGLLTISNVLICGGTMILRKKFSASNFWKDAIKYRATVAQYIGEICRFLLAQPKIPEEKQHQIKMMCGNGLRSQIWTEFTERFNIERIAEFYGATEGNANVVNITGKVGAVGFLPRALSFMYPVCLIRVDPESGEAIRGPDDLCIKCQPDEPGHMVGKILSNNPMNAFDGYVDKAATKKKIIRNCFSKGDTAFLSGDILTMDEDGYLYFMDRTGDTFRWRGENVSTNEVESIISKSLELATCAVYGVEVPGTEGRAGMVAIQTTDELDLKLFYNKIKVALPVYAVPIFIRICTDIESTGTYKIRKVELQKEGYDLDKVKDPLYFLDPQRRSYVRLEKETYQKIQENKVKL